MIEPKDFDDYKNPLLIDELSDDFENPSAVIWGNHGLFKR
jgi:hypothetical protein